LRVRMCGWVGGMFRVASSREPCRDHRRGWAQRDDRSAVRVRSEAHASMCGAHATRMQHACNTHATCNTRATCTLHATCTVRRASSAAISRSARSVPRRRRVAAAWQRARHAPATRGCYRYGCAVRDAGFKRMPAVVGMAIFLQYWCVPIHRSAYRRPPARSCGCSAARPRRSSHSAARCGIVASFGLLRARCTFVATRGGVAAT
jgi:hypothetical protein